MNSAVLGPSVISHLKQRAAPDWRILAACALYLSKLQHMAIEQHWLVNGTHYQKTLGTACPLICSLHAPSILHVDMALDRPLVLHVCVYSSAQNMLFQFSWISIRAAIYEVLCKVSRSSSPPHAIIRWCCTVFPESNGSREDVRCRHQFSRSDPLHD